MGLFDGLEDPLGEVSDAMRGFGADDEADDLDAATRWIQSRIDASGTIPTLRARFLIGSFQPGTVPIDQVDWADAIVQAGGIGEKLLARAGAPAGYAELGAAVLEKELDDRFDIEKAHERPLHWVESIVVEEGLSSVWTAEVVLAKPDAAGLLANQLGLPNAPISLVDSVARAFRNDGGGWDAEIADLSTLGTQIAQAIFTPDQLADRVWDTESPDRIDRDPTRVTVDHTLETGTPFLGKTLAREYLGAFARLSLARRFDDDNFTLNERWFSGRVVAFEDLGYDPLRRVRRVKLTIRPHLAQLALRRRHRAFKGMNAVEIVKQLLSEHGLYVQPSTKDATGTAIRFAPGGRELFGPLGVPDAATAAIGKLSGIDPFGVGESVSGAVNELLEQPIEDWRPRREYCVQYGESDLELVERLLAEEGLTYFFEHRERLETLVICEDPRLAGKKVLTAGRVPLIASPARLAALASEGAWDVAVARRPVPSGVTLRDRTYARPYDPTDLKAGESLDLLSPTNLSSLTTLGGLEQMANQALGLAGELAGVAGTEDYAGPEAQWFEWPARLEYPVPEDPTDPFGYEAYDGPPMAQLRLEGFRSRGAVCQGSSECATLAPGANVNLLYGPFDVLHSPVQKPQRFLITKVRHVAPDPSAPLAPGAPPFETSYSNTFEGVHVALAYRPPTPPPKPRIRGVHTAFVIDVARGEDPTESPAEVSVIEAQSAWRVRVRMPWERAGEAIVGGEAARAATAAEEGSRWLRFAQPFTGAGFGWLTVPRVGMEVVLGYEEGDPDRPYVLGALYADAYDRASGARHASSDEPADVAHGRVDATPRLHEAGFTTRAWPQAERGAGVRGNAVVLDDTAGDEERGHGGVVVYAQHDYAKEVGGRRDETRLGDHVTTVRADQRIEVGASQRELVHGDQTLLARHPSESPVDWGREVVIGGDETISVGGGERGAPAEGEREKPERDAMVDTVEGDDSLVVGEGRELHVAGGEVIRIDGEGASEEVPGRLLDVARGNSRVEIEGNDELFVTGDRRVTAAGGYTVVAGKVDMKTVTSGEHDGLGRGDENGGLVLDERGASLSTDGAARIEADSFTAQSRADRVLVKAATRITLHDGTGQGSRIVLDAKTKTVSVRIATGAALALGVPGASLDMTESAIELAAGPSKWRTDLESGGATSVMDGPEVTFEATDEIWLHAPVINLGKDG
ncbi:MAG: hypothetical protein KF729_36205 [Sandaracinaceae bacterium]|nr:hypothetical protein [Sandaracinaceae bacterium]